MNSIQANYLKSLTALVLVIVSLIVPAAARKSNRSIIFDTIAMSIGSYLNSQVRCARIICFK